MCLKGMYIENLRLNHSQQKSNVALIMRNVPTLKKPTLIRFPVHIWLINKITLTSNWCRYHRRVSHRCCDPFLGRPDLAKKFEPVLIADGNINIFFGVSNDFQESDILYFFLKKRSSLI